MKQEDKELLLKDLCARLPYGVKLHVKGEYHKYHKLSSVDVDAELIYYFEGLNLCDQWFGNCKPYLRPMSSMTEEEKKEMHNLLSPEGTAIYGYDGISMPMNHYGEFVSYEFMNRIIQYLLENHFDFMGLIPKGLAIEVTEENNPYKE